MNDKELDIKLNELYETARYLSKTLHEADYKHIRKMMNIFSDLLKLTIPADNDY